MAYFDYSAGVAGYGAAAFGYPAAAPYTVPSVPAFGAVGAVDELRWEPMPLPKALANVMNRGQQPAQAATACTTASGREQPRVTCLCCFGHSRRTVFITGFPNDVKERELNNMLRFMPGYEASQMNWKNGQVSSRGCTRPSTMCPVCLHPGDCRAHTMFRTCADPCACVLSVHGCQAQGFALFYTGAAARAACAALAGLR